ncbi:unnamed protein product [Blepharisma stoltei]|uniref:EF-hand domain-containing protein n=1 Tax=Blepharisma stoltei TaxID=1481888 RepID=A0AAU9JDW0_9CILI|nr:unnamed protein product [Blepharisma stoltei]
MSFPQMKFDTRSAPKFNDEDSLKDEERFFDKRIPHPPRPESAKAPDGNPLKNVNRKPARPITATKKIFPVWQKPVPNKEAEPIMLAKLRPKNIQMDKERLYDENIALKMKVNSLTEDVILLRTRISQLERDIGKKEIFIDQKSPTEKPNSKNVHLITNLKQNVKELRSELQTKETELISLRKNTKTSRIMELEAEVQAYVDECTRLKHHIEDLLHQNGIENPTGEYEGFEAQSYRQTLVNSNLQKENAELNQALSEAKEEIFKLKSKLSDPEKKKKKKSTSRKNDEHLKTEIQILKQQLENERKIYENKETDIKNDSEKLKKSNLETFQRMQSFELKVKEQNSLIEQLKTQVAALQKEMQQTQKNQKPAENNNLWDMTPGRLTHPPKLCKMIYEIIYKKKMLLAVFLSLLDKNNNGYIGTDDIIQVLKTNGYQAKKKYIEEVIQMATGKMANIIHIKALEKFYEQYNYSSSPISTSSEEFPVKPQKTFGSAANEIKIKIGEEQPVMKSISVSSSVRSENIREIENEDKNNAKVNEIDKKSENKPEAPPLYFTFSKESNDKVIKGQAAGVSDKNEIRNVVQQKDEAQVIKKEPVPPPEDHKPKDQQRVEALQRPKSRPSTPIQKQISNEKIPLKSDYENPPSKREKNQLEAEAPQRSMSRSSTPIQKMPSNDKIPQRSDYENPPSKREKNQSEKNILKKEPTDERIKEKQIVQPTQKKEPLNIKEKPKEEEEEKTQPTEQEIPTIKPEEIKTVLNHVSLQMQLNRQPKSKLASFLFGSIEKSQKLNKEEISKFLSQSPLKIPSVQNFDKFCQFLIEPSQATIRPSELSSLSASVDFITKKLFISLEDWPIFTQEDEKEYDEKLTEIIDIYFDSLIAGCKKNDLNNTGKISIEQFQTVLRQQNIELPRNMMNYIILLFYSTSLELNEVPYEKFLNAYHNQNAEEYEEDYEQGEEIADEERAKIVGHLLEIIAKVMKDKKVSVRDIFIQNHRGMVMPDNFVKGLQKLGVLDSIGQEFIILILQALQCEDTDEMCILIDDLEEVFKHYGISIPDEIFEEENEEKNFSKENSRYKENSESSSIYEEEPYEETKPKQNPQLINPPSDADLIKSIEKKESIENDLGSSINSDYEIENHLYNKTKSSQSSAEKNKAEEYSEYESDVNKEEYSEDIEENYDKNSNVSYGSEYESDQGSEID